MNQAREGWGYLVWGVTTAAIVIPELSAVFTKQVIWPTISGTVGHLEYEHDWVGLIVVALIVGVLFGVIRYPATRLGPHVTPTVGRTTLGRLTRALPKEKQLTPWFLAGLGAGVLIASVITAGIDPNDHFVLAYVMYGTIGCFFLAVPSALAFFDAKDVPFPTLFRTIANLEVRFRPIAFVPVIGLVILLIHLALYPWPAVFHQLKGLTPPTTYSL